MVEPAAGPQALHKHPFLGISPQVPVRPLGTCGGTLPAAASPAYVLSEALQEGHEPSVTCVVTLGQRAPPEPHNARGQGTSTPQPHAKPVRVGRVAVGSPPVLAHTLQSLHVLFSEGVKLLLQLLVSSLFHLGSREMTNPVVQRMLWPSQCPGRRTPLWAS